MCGRFSLIVDASVLAGVFEIDPPQNLRPRFNIAPTQTIPIVRAGGAQPREWAEVRWGLVPSWAKDPKIGARMINARGETVAEKPSFRSAVKNRRCLIPAEVDKDRHRQAAQLHSLQRWPGLCLCRSLGALAPIRGRGPRHLHHHHDHA